MTPSELSALDLEVARAIGYEAKIIGDLCTALIDDVWQPFTPSTDTAECMRLAAERKFYIHFLGYGVAIYQQGGEHIFENYIDHSGDKLAAMRVAICRAVVASHSPPGAV